MLLFERQNSKTTLQYFDPSIHTSILTNFRYEFGKDILLHLMKPFYVRYW